MKRFTLIAGLVLLLGGCDSEWLLTSDGRVDEGNALLAEGAAAEALAAYEAAAAELPESPQLDYDRGLAASAAGRHDDATQRLLRALDTQDPELRRKVYAALGAAYARWAEQIEKTPAAAPPAQDDATPEATPEDPRALAKPKWERAVEHLEKALVLSPTPDPDVLRNLEVALLRVDPPCSGRNDAHEPNDAPEQAAAITLTGAAPADPNSGLVAPGAAEDDTLKWKEQLLACPDDVDWFRLDLDEGDRLTAKLSRPDDSGALSLTLFGPGGLAALVPEGDAAAEEVAFTAPAGGGPYLMRVANVEGDEVSYGLDVEVRPPCHASEDRFEPNDSAAEAQGVTLGQLPGLKICPEDGDWFAVTLAEGESLFAFASLPEKKGDEAKADEAAPADVPLTLALTDAEGRVLATGGPAGQARVATLLTPGAGRYLVKVEGAADLESRYDLLIEVIPPCPDGDDAYEDNDRAEDATALEQLLEQAGGGQAGQGGAAQPGAPRTGATQLLRICPGDEDWFSLEVAKDQPVQVSAVFDHGKGDLEMVAFDDTGATQLSASDTSSPESNGEGLVLTGGEDGPKAYRMVVRGKAGAENFYLLRVDQPQGDGGGDSQGEPPPEDEENEPEDGEGEPQKPDEPKDGKDEPKDPKDGEGEPKQPRPEDQPQDRRPAPEQARPADPLEEALDKLDRNPQNLEALETLKASPLTNHPPEKDW